MNTPIIPDILQPNLALVFCGTAPSRVSAQKGAYYANPANKFWRTLFAVGLIPSPLPASAYARLPEFGIGLTDMAKYAVGNDSDLSASDFDREAFIRKIEQYQPRCVAFTSKKAASVFLQCATAHIHYGLQSVTMVHSNIAITHFFVLPSPSGLAISYWDERIWHNLAEWKRQNCA
jgi:double-stranded uracil-DNA glycosylase